MAVSSLSLAEETSGFFLGAASSENPTGLGFWSTLPRERLPRTNFSSAMENQSSQQNTDDIFDDLQLRAGYDFGTALGFLSLQQGEMGEKKTPEIGIGLIFPLGNNLQISGQVSRTGLLEDGQSRRDGDSAFSVGATFQF
ncbi:hypothetical protein [Epibacterium ulvae]|uniref:hypothetical protein n=1 Tax=Epibacterium ulvae TaxID=1156985 RepID=UPI0024919E8D|nr:hypothetical protein [Epibacterium ulvae]